MRIKYYIILFILIIIAIYSCSDNQCNTDTESTLRTEILVKDAALTELKYLDSLSIYSPEWEDSIHYLDLDVTTKKKKSLYFMLSPTSDTTEFILTSRQAEFNDTVFVFYEREMIFLSPECGFVTNFTIDTVISTDNYIDSLKIVNNKITINKDGHIQIYF